MVEGPHPSRVDELLELVSLELAVVPPLILMDEPFGAIDPINSERLQNEFLRLQQEIRKTIVFVTHDIDEAIKMGDKIAILPKGGKLAQYAAPAELLRYPESKFVEDYDLDDVLRDALASLLVAETHYGPVVDASGRLTGVLSLEVIGQFLHEAPAESRTGAELVEESE